jgi:hypothetical protein
MSDRCTILPEGRRPFELNRALSPVNNLGKSRGTRRIKWILDSDRIIWTFKPVRFTFFILGLDSELDLLTSLKVIKLKF